MDWLDLRAVQGTLKSPLQHHIFILQTFIEHLICFDVFVEIKDLVSPPPPEFILY